MLPELFYHSLVTNVTTKIFHMTAPTCIMCTRDIVPHVEHKNIPITVPESIVGKTVYFVAIRKVENKN